MPPGATSVRGQVRGHEVIPIVEGWQAAAAAPGERTVPEDLDGLSWIAATVPGTAAGALRDAGLDAGDLDAQDCWFRTSFTTPPVAAGEEVVLRLGGIATLAEVFVNGRPVLSSESMFQEHAIDVGAALVPGANELAIRCRALAPELTVQRRPRARWRTRLVADNNLRWFRTMLLGRIPSFAPRPAPVGPWRPITLERRRGVVVEQLRLRPRLDGNDGILAVTVRLRLLDGADPSAIDVVVAGPGDSTRSTRGALDLDAGVTGLVVATGEIRVPDVERWWPHSHGEPALYSVRLDVSGATEEDTIDGGRIGFRTLAAGGRPDHDVDRDGLFVHVNEVPVFARGALWTPLDIVGLAPSVGEIHAALEVVRDAGMNMVRLPGFGPYEQDAFHDACDELGILVWQDLAYMSMDYPFEDEAFGRRAADEVEALVGRIAGRPSTAVLCGNSEVEQQVAMLGLDLGLARIPFFDETAPAIARAADLDAVYVPSAPFGGEVPMVPDRGVIGYYGVGGYRAPLSDARTSGVRFAAECLAFANVPDEEALATLVPVAPYEAFVHNPYWKAGVARDAGSGWDFDDLRDDYLKLVFGVDPDGIRRYDHDRYLELSRAVTGEVMAHVFGEWRRAGSPSGGGMILWLRDLVAGAGYGVVDHRGRPKTAYHHLRRILAPTAVWLVDEGIGGVVAHVANDGPAPLTARLRVRLFTDLELAVGEAFETITLAPHSAIERNVEGVLGHFVDASWAYRFGPPAQDAIVATLEQVAGDAQQDVELVSQAFHFPAGRPLVQEPAQRLGLSATSATADDGTVEVEVTTQRLAYGVRIHAAGFSSSDDAFSVEPGGSRTVTLRPAAPGTKAGGGWLTALNLLGQVAIRPVDPAA
jgi:beta-mannosidase